MAELPATVNQWDDIFHIGTPFDLSTSRIFQPTSFLPSLADHMELSEKKRGPPGPHLGDLLQFASAFESPEIHQKLETPLFVVVFAAFRLQSLPKEPI